MKNQGKKINLIKLGIVGLIIIMLLGYLCWAIISLIKHPSDTFMIEEGKLSLEETVEGYIIREETVVQGENYKNGIVKIKYEGEKIAKGEAIFRYQNNKESELVSKIEELDVKIEEALANETNLFPNDIALLETQIKTRLEEVYKQNDIQKITKIKNEINTYINKKARIAGEQSPAGSYIKKLINERREYEEELNSNSEYVTATTSGLISYSIDGYESILSSDNLDSVTKELLEDINIKTGQIIANSDKAAKIINNFEAYIAVVMNSESAMNAKEGDKVNLQLSTSEEIPATIEKIKETEKNERIIIFKIKKGVESLINYRKISLEVIWWSSTGLRVPNSAIITEGDFNYIIKNRAGYTDKIMIKILKQNETYSIIDNYETSELKELGYSSTEIRSFKKISLYDEVILEPNAT